MLRNSNNLPRIEPVGMEPVEKLDPDMVYGMTQRVLTEIKIFEVRKGIIAPKFQLKSFKNKTPLDVYNMLGHISASFDELNRSSLSPSYVFAETIRIYEDLTMILNRLNIKDNTIPTRRLHNATPLDSLKMSLKVLREIRNLQREVGIKTIDISSFKRKDATPSDVYAIIGVIEAELQPLKAYIGLTKEITPAAKTYTDKVPADIEQLMGWNLRKILLIKNLGRR